MFRCNKEIEISSSILNCTSDKDESAILNWLNILSNEFSVTPNEMICRLFLQTKHCLNNESIQKLYNFALNNTLQSNTIVKSNVNTKPTATATRDLCKLPTDIFNQIGSYLTIKSRLRLSITNRMYHKTTQHKGFFNEMKTLKLSSKQLKTIYENNCGLECCEMTRRLDIICIPNEHIDCQENANKDSTCILSKIIKKIQKEEEETDKVYCKLDWFKRALNRVSSLSVSKNWNCIFSHLPMEWIFDINNIYNGDNAVDIRQSGSNVNLNASALNAFATSYESYWLKKCSKFQQLKTGTVPVIGKDIRPIGFMSVHRRNLTFEVATKFYGNYEKFRIKLPQSAVFSSDRKKYRISTLEQYFTLFHSRLNVLRMLFSSTGVNSQISILTDIVSQIFNDNDNSTKQLIKDLNTTETQLSFDDFLKKYNCQSKQLPQIKSVYFRCIHGHGVNEYGINRATIHDYDCVLLKQFFQHDKLMKLFNFANSITTLGFSFVGGKIGNAKMEIDLSSLKNSCCDLLKRLINTKQIDFDFSIKSKKNVDKKKLDEFFNQFLSDLVVYILVNYDEIEAIRISFIWSDVAAQEEESSITQRIQIGSKQELSINNRDDLVNRVKFVTKQLYNHFEMNQDVCNNNSPSETDEKYIYRVYHWIRISRNFCLS